MIPAPVLGFICLVPLFGTLYHIPSPRQAFFIGSVFGAVLGMISLFWALESLSNFFVGSAAIAWTFYIGGIIALALQFGILGATIGWFRRKTKYDLLWLCFCASAWTLMEYANAWLYSGMPWLQSSLVSIVADAVSCIQWASFGGAQLVSYWLVMIQLGIVGVVSLFRSRAKIVVGISTILLLLIFITGNIFIRRHTLAIEPTSTFSVAIINENTPAEFKWTESTGPSMVRKLLSLHEQAVKLNPDLILWAESAVPWTYAPDDDFIAQITQYGVPEILGINTDYKANKVYNSAYFLGSNQLVQRNDKRYLLTFAESPLGADLFHFDQQAGFYVQPGHTVQVFHHPKGKIGAIICNESFVSKAAIALVQQGAEILTLISNDGWVDNSEYLVRQHWLSAKLRAVEMGRDMVVNCNLGYNGLITSTGEDLIKWKSNQSEVNVVQGKFYNRQTLFSKFPSLFIQIIIFECILFLLLTFLKNNQL